VPPGAPVLDLAAGSGRHARLFLARGHAVAAVDRDIAERKSPDALNGNVNRAAPGGTFGHEIDANLEVCGGQFDGAVPVTGGRRGVRDGRERDESDEANEDGREGATCFHVWKRSWAWVKHGLTVRRSCYRLITALSGFGPPD
jgi:hypothetical protein